jgi:two-component system, cell cycle sensor histidine kinase PleC
MAYEPGARKSSDLLLKCNRFQRRNIRECILYRSLGSLKYVRKLETVCARKGASVPSVATPETSSQRARRASVLRRYVARYERQCEEDEAELALRRSRDEAQRAAERAREAQAAAEAATRAKAAFMTTMSRELCRPLEAIMRMAQSLGTEQPAATERSGGIREIAAVATHLRDLIGDVLELARIEAGEVALLEEDLNLDSVIADSLDAIDARAQAKGVTVNFFPTATRIRSDGKRLRRIVDEVLTNALSSTPAGGGIAIELFEEREGGLMLSVIDGGAGMTAAEVDRALKPIGASMADGRADTQQLSLAVAKAFIEVQGGRFFLESVPGSGTAACIYLPPRSVRRSA